MRKILLGIFSMGLLACNQPQEPVAVLEKRIDSLENQLENSYKPGFGDFMGFIQTHHAKLWFAGQNENWELADFELHELEEAIDDIQEIHATREETKYIDMIIEPLEKVDEAVDNKDKAAFKQSYQALTNACNQCHTTVNMEFIEIKIPDSPPFSNQIFTPKE